MKTVSIVFQYSITEKEFNTKNHKKFLKETQMVIDYNNDGELFTDLKNEGINAVNCKSFIKIQ